MPDTLEDREVDLLKRHLGAIVTLETLTVPLYLAAVYSFTERALAFTERGAAPLYDMQQKLLSVAVQEMYHLQLASNLCNAFQITPEIPRLRLARGEDIVIPHVVDDGEPIVVRLGNVPAVLSALLEIEEPAPQPYPEPNEAVVYPSIGALYHATLRLLARYMEAYRTTATALDPHFSPNNKQIAFATFASTYRFNVISSRPLVAAVASAITDQGEGNVVAAQIGGPFRSSDEDDVLPEFRPRPGTRFAAYGKEAHYTRFREVERDLAERDWASLIGGPVFYEDSGAPSADLPPWAASEADLEDAMSTLWSCVTDILQEGVATGRLPAYSADPSKPSFGDVMLSFKYVLPQRWQQGRAPSFVYRPGVTAEEVQKAMDIVDPLCLFHWDARTQALRRARHFNACQGLNSCKGLGWGGIATEAGNGACATVELHTCGGNNACRFHGGCGFLVSQSGEACAGMPAGDLLPPSEQWVPGANSCRALGGCQTPISTRQVFSRAAGPTIDSAGGPDWDPEAKRALKSLRGYGVWDRAREIFALRMRVDRLPEPISAKVDHLDYDGTARRAAIAPTSR